MLTQLTNAYEAAIQAQAQQRKQQVTPFARKVAQSIFSARLLAMEDSNKNIAQYRVVSAPTGSGKSSYALAFIRAYIEVVPDASVLYLVETIRQAEDTFRAMSDLIGENVAVWTVAYDLDSSPEDVLSEHGFVPSRQFSVFALGHYPVVIATHKFYTGPRSDKACVYRGRNRRITFIDERLEGVTVFDVDTGLIKTVRDKLAQEDTTIPEHVTRLTELHDHVEGIWRSASSKSVFDVLTQATHCDLGWFASAKAEPFLNSPDEQVKQVFSFGRSLATGYAFLSRYDRYGDGARFVGYDMNMPLMPGSIILDATADIDGLSLIAKNRTPVPVPHVDFRNLTITHIDPEPLNVVGKKKRLRVSEVAKRADLAKPYAEWIFETIKQHTHPGEKVLAVVNKPFLDHDYLPARSDLADAHDLEGRHVCFIHWGIGIGSNRWKDANAVFLFGEFHKPRRAMVATGLGWREERATRKSLAPYQAFKRKDGPLLSLQEGDLCRWMKQMAMRGNARNIDAHGVCGVQRLYVTGDYDRLIRHKDRMFPGAKVTLAEPDKRLQYGGREALIALLYQVKDDVITVPEIRQATGIDLHRNKKRYLAMPEVVEAMNQNDWDFMPGAGGRGNVGRFIRRFRQAA
ncbi:hypothetical protein CQ12_33415 [Bradyrhizobium jicamae]|uniref:Helicase/UvrB N-terminal domain-containing protein n=1 Tax=Bradyrhizobium jicamae TaxID=280332 RepID=A0A0R3LEX4_9BRAD|nr:DEAD/DEAH box helicase family protein [Bradyrhizobium jicamae]KRR06369.1 hypothetical protein CQ12_33415 [Bradyrhizobium jicamae]